MLDLLISSAIQGITEFIPVSSSAHLIIVAEFVNLDKNNLTLDVSLHIGSFFAVILYFTKDLNNFLKNKKLLFKIIISSLPVGFFGFLLAKFDLIQYLRNFKTIGWSTIIFGILLYISDLKKNKKEIKKDLDYKSMFIIGLFQIFSLIPGASRSGVTITGARLLSFNKTEAAKISFLTSLPVLFYASIYNLTKIYSENNINISIINFFAIFLSFIFSYITIRFFLSFLKTYNLIIFVYYRIILGCLILAYAYF